MNIESLFVIAELVPDFGIGLTNTGYIVAGKIEKYENGVIVICVKNEFTTMKYHIISLIKGINVDTLKMLNGDNSK